MAKIFDPLYYSWDPQDIAYWSDLQYSREAAAYEQVCRAGINGKYLPKYYGSWTFELPLLSGFDQPPSTREVRLVLVDYIPHPTMYSLILKGRAEDFSLDTRLNTLAEAIEKYCWLDFYGVAHHDLAPRNILVSPDLQVTLIDLSHAYVLGRQNSELPLYRDEGRPRSPIDLVGVNNELLPWLPEQYHYGDVFEDWMRARWGKSDTFQPSQTS